MDNGIRLSIVLPCYNEGLTLSNLIEGYRSVLKDIQYVEMVLVDNGSTDDTGQQLLFEKEKSNPFKVKIVTVEKNQGYGFGILAGVYAATGEYIAWSHADLQCPPGDVVSLYEKVIQSNNPKRIFGKGFRVNDRGGSIFFTRVQSFLSRIILGFKLEEINAQPKLFHRDFIQTFKRPPNGYELDIYVYYKALLSELEIVTIEVLFLERAAGESKWAYSIFSKIKFILSNFNYLLILRLNKNKI